MDSPAFNVTFRDPAVSRLAELASHKLDIAVNHHDPHERAAAAAASRAASSLAGLLLSEEWAKTMDHRASVAEALLKPARLELADDSPDPAGAWLGRTVRYTIPDGDTELLTNGLQPGAQLAAIVCRDFGPIEPGSRSVDLIVLVDGGRLIAWRTDVMLGDGPARFQLIG